MSGDAVFILVSVLLIAAFTAVMIAWHRRSLRLWRKLRRMLDEQDR